jgi:hypothetical protein
MKLNVLAPSLAAALLICSASMPVHAQKAALVRNVDNAAFQPVFFSASLNYPSSAQLYVVPAGKRLVIEFFSAEIFAAPPLRFALAVGDPATPGISNMIHFIPPPAQGIAIAQPMRMYVDAGQSVTVFVSSTVAGSCAVSVTGHLVNLPAKDPSQ